MKSAPLFAALALLTACSSYYEPVRKVNVYYDHIYKEHTIPSCEDACAWFKPWDCPRYCQDMRYGDKSRNFYSPRPFMEETTLWTSRGLDITRLQDIPYSEAYYQDQAGKCFLYTVNDMIKLKEEAGFDADSTDAVFLLDKDGAKIVSEKEYERLKPTFKSHKFDPKLCKPKPANLEK